MKLRKVILSLLILSLNHVVKSADVKSSLTFVIDDTGSMSNDIAQVKLGANAIFDKVTNSNSSQIEDFVLVTFNDPDVKLRTITKDRETFKSALQNIRVHGGDDCPEYAMSGILMALQKSREGSSLYIFTDASAYDYKKYEEVAALSQKMGCQLVFVLTGQCSAGRKAQDYLVYEKLAKDTNGQVFHLERNEIGQILKYVEETIENRKNILTSKWYPPGYGNTFEVPVDGDTKEIVIAVSGLRPKVSVTDSGGTKWPTTDVTRLTEIAIVKVVGVKPDVYKVVVGSASETHVVVSGSTSVHFQHGFSVITPSAITDTVPQPVPGEKSHLSIKLATEGGEVELIGVQILDMEDRVILEAPLKLVDKDEQFYTTDAITPPSHMFKIAIKGYDKNSKTFLTRISLTPVKPQIVKSDVKTKAPVVTIDKAPKIDSEYDKPLQLKCKVSGYPKPSVIWESDDKSAVFSHTISTVELPYDYVSVLDIRNVRNNAAYTCTAVNSAGDGHDSIAVELSSFFNVLAMPEDTNIEYHKPGSIPCQVAASPPATVSWYKGRRPLSPDGNLELSSDGSVLTIRSMEPYMADEYICEARNSVGRKVVSFTVDISGVEMPEINKSTYYVNALKSSNADIRCEIIRGNPEPTIHWWYKDAASTEYVDLTEMKDTIHIDNVESTHAGTYRCMAENVVGQDYHEIELIVERKPSISRDFNHTVTANQSQVVTLPCVADGFPTPDITWKHNGAPIRSSRHTFFRDGSLRFIATSSDNGMYECEARNTHGVDNININLNIIVPVEIESPKQSSLELMVGSPVGLPCRADGYPKPIITWTFRGKTTNIVPRKFMPSDASGELRFARIQQWQSGFYTCVATNPGGSKNITYEVSVLAPPSIRYTTKQFRGVLGDMQLRIPCEATGYPKPDITWSINGDNIPSGTEWFDISDDGSLIIKNLDNLSAGSYVCSASNKYGKKEEDFNVIVDPYPESGFPSSSIALEEGTTATVPCSVPQKKTDRLRWFKDGRNISSSELELRNVRLSDSGIYTCRVSYVDRPAQTGSVRVEVGVAPRFMYDDDKNIAFEKYGEAFMDCSATGQPTPEVKWHHDGKQIMFNEFNYVLEMRSASDRGRYTCYVSNPFGTIKQEFVISSFECLLDIHNDFNENEPLMLTTSDELTHFESIDGFLRIPKDESIKLVCPSGFNKIPSTEVIVTCETEKQFILEPSKNRYAYSDLKCRGRFEPVVKRTGRRCTNGNSEMLNIGFDVRGRFKEIYQVCLDVVTKNPIYTKLTMEQPLANGIANNDTDWFNDGSPVDLESLYDCNYQNIEITSILDKEFHRYSGCCFAKRMLVNPKDVAPGLPQTATYTHLNVVPHWGTCNSKNWEDLEQRVRDLVVTAERPLQVWTGTAQELQLTDARGEEKNVVLNSRGKDYQVPKYLWKVVQDPYTKATLAIIQVNVPDLKLVDARKYLLCKDVCSEAEWMKNRRWRNVNNGFTYCCSLEEFERAFRYDGVFPRYDKLLLSASTVPVESYLHAI